MSTNHSFPPIAAPDARILILGSMPGQKSLEENQYYAHPRNSFWPIIFKLLKADNELTYSGRKTLLLKNNIALWDVLKSCYRQGSLDSNIDDSSIEPNDFHHFFSEHKAIKAIFFNGAKAEQVFKKNVLKQQDVSCMKPSYYKLPSTSPAHASLSFEQKLMEWKKIKTFLC